MAVLNGDITMIELLLRFGAEIDVLDDYRRTSLHWALETGKLELVRLLIDAGTS